MPYQDESWKLSNNREEMLPLSTTKRNALTYLIGAGSDPGKRRKRNEDSIFAASSTCNIMLLWSICGC